MTVSAEIPLRVPGMYPLLKVHVEAIQEAVYQDRQHQELPRINTVKRPERREQWSVKHEALPQHPAMIGYQQELQLREARWSVQIALRSATEVRARRLVPQLRLQERELKWIDKASVHLPEIQAAAM